MPFQLRILSSYAEMDCIERSPGPPELEKGRLMGVTRRSDELGPLTIALDSGLMNGLGVAFSGGTNGRDVDGLLADPLEMLKAGRVIGLAPDVTVGGVSADTGVEVALRT